MTLSRLAGALACTLLLGTWLLVAAVLGLGREAREGAVYLIRRAWERGEE